MTRKEQMIELWEHVTGWFWIVATVVCAAVVVAAVSTFFGDPWGVDAWVKQHYQPPVRITIEVGQ